MITQVVEAERAVCGRLLAFARSGQPPKVALVACMRKLLTFLNVTVKTQSVWRIRPLAVLTPRSVTSSACDLDVIKPAEHTPGKFSAALLS